MSYGGTFPVDKNSTPLPSPENDIQITTKKRYKTQKRPQESVTSIDKKGKIKTKSPRRKEVHQTDQIESAMEQNNAVEETGSTGHDGQATLCRNCHKKIIKNASVTSLHSTPRRTGRYNFWSLSRTSFEKKKKNLSKFCFTDERTPITKPELLITEKTEWQFPSPITRKTQKTTDATHYDKSSDSESANTIILDAESLYACSCNSLSSNDSPELIREQANDQSCYQQDAKPPKFNTPPQDACNQTDCLVGSTCPVLYQIQESHNGKYKNYQSD